VSRAYLSRKLIRPLPTKDGGTLRTVLDARAYMLRCRRIESEAPGGKGRPNYSSRRPMSALSAGKSNSRCSMTASSTLGHENPDAFHPATSLGGLRGSPTRLAAATADSAPGRRQERLARACTHKSNETLRAYVCLALNTAREQTFRDRRFGHSSRRAEAAAIGSEGWPFARTRTHSLARQR